MSSRVKQQLSTSSVEVYDREFNNDDFYHEAGELQTERGEVIGIWLRLTCTTAGGTTAVRDIFEPEGLEGKYEWTDAGNKVAAAK